MIPRSLPAPASSCYSPRVAETNLLEKYSALRSLGLAELTEVWNHYDSDGSGYIEVGAELDRFLGDLLESTGIEATPEDVREFVDTVLETFDVDANGKLDFAELEELLNG